MGLVMSINLLLCESSAHHNDAQNHGFRGLPLEGELRGVAHDLRGPSLRPSESAGLPLATSVTSGVEVTTTCSPAQCHQLSASSTSAEQQGQINGAR